MPKFHRFLPRIPAPIDFAQPDVGKRSTRFGQGEHCSEGGRAIGCGAPSDGANGAFGFSNVRGVDFGFAAAFLNFHNLRLS